MNERPVTSRFRDVSEIPNPSLGPSRANPVPRAAEAASASLLEWERRLPAEGPLSFYRAVLRCRVVRRTASGACR
jgi:hypothetical protein